MSNIFDFCPIWGCWEIDRNSRPLGKGSFGTVWKAHRKDDVTGDLYYSAIKHISIPQDEKEIRSLIEESVLSDTQSAKKIYNKILESLVSEIKTMYSLRGHTNIVSYEDHLIVPKKDEVGYDLFIRMELLTSLSAKLEQGGFKRADVIKLGMDSAMRQVNAAEILDIAMAGTSATLLAKRWESALLVNVDNDTLARLLANDDAMNALMRIEGFRSLNEDIQTIINKSEDVKKKKKDAENLTPRERKELSDEEKEYKSKRKLIQEKLIKFATRLPVFMYLSDYREFSLKDVITALEPKLFGKVTGLTVKDFELLVSLNVFNEGLMNDAVYKFKRYEDASLTYTGIDSHECDARVGLYATSISREEYDVMAGLQQSSMAAPAGSARDLPRQPYGAEPPANGAGAVTTQQIKKAPAPAKQPAKAPESTAAKPRPTAPSPTPSRPIPPKPAMPTYRPAFVPPRPAEATRHAEAPKPDLSRVAPGVTVIHRAFGEGVVTSIEKKSNGSAYVHVRFKTAQKSFGYPSAFYDGFLKVKEIPHNARGT